MALPLKELIIKAKTRQARLKAIKKLIQNIPVSPGGYYYEEPYEIGYEKGQAELANQIRAILHGPAFEEAYRPGNTENGKNKNKA